MPESISFRPASKSQIQALTDLQQKTGRTRTELLQDALTKYLGDRPEREAQRLDDRLSDLEQEVHQYRERTTLLESQMDRIQRFALGMSNQ